MTFHFDTIWYLLAQETVHFLISSFRYQKIILFQNPVVESILTSNDLKQSQVMFLGVMDFHSDTVSEIN